MRVFHLYGHLRRCVSPKIQKLHLHWFISHAELIYSRHLLLKVDVIWMIEWLTEACCPIAGRDITAHGLDQPR